MIVHARFSFASIIFFWDVICQNLQHLSAILVCSLRRIGFLVFICHAPAAMAGSLAGLRNIEFSYCLHYSDQYIMHLLPQPFACLLSQHTLSPYAIPINRFDSTFKIRLLNRDTPTNNSQPPASCILNVPALAQLKIQPLTQRYRPLDPTREKKGSHHICKELKILRVPPSVLKRCIHECGNYDQLRSFLGADNEFPKMSRSWGWDDVCHHLKTLDGFGLWCRSASRISCSDFRLRIEVHLWIPAG